MTTRTFQFYGQGWGNETAEIIATLNGETVYSGPIPTQAGLPPTDFTGVVLFTASNLAVSDAGAFPMSITVTRGNAVFTNVWADHSIIPNPAYSPEQYAVVTDPNATPQDRATVASAVANPPFSPAELEFLNDPTDPEELNAILTAHNAQHSVSSGSEFAKSFWPVDSRSNVAIDGVPQPTPNPRPPGQNGEWHWFVYTGQELTYDLNVLAGA